ncbi:MAG TPA: hypothetical protein VGE63_01390 [Candidatus Paceibacterota bacterium]
MLTPFASVFLPSIITFFVAVLLVEPFTTFLYKHRLWKKTRREDNNPDEISQAYMQIHDGAKEVKTPRMGGMLIWLSVLAVVILFFLLPSVAPNDAITRLNVLSKEQTLMVALGFFAGALIGLIDDLTSVKVIVGKFFEHGIPRWLFFTIMFAVAIASGWWLFAKLGMTTLLIPLMGTISIGWLIIPLFVIVMLGLFSSGVIDGIDGLAGGVMTIIYAAYGVIALLQAQYDLAGFLFAIMAALLVFLWFNIPPARFYLGETGMLALTMGLAYAVFITKQVVVLIIIALPLVATSLSSLIQIYSKKYLGKKVFKVAPLHHHFQAIGWTNEKVVMRYWVVTIACAIIGIALTQLVV